MKNILHVYKDLALARSELTAFSRESNSVMEPMSMMTIVDDTRHMFVPEMTLEEAKQRYGAMDFNQIYWYGELALDESEELKKVREYMNFRIRPHKD